ncbi:8-amino-7-oxononanoate synthase [Bacillus taeanensis]|uniref:8-amino-7-ketopelargonate synthase n=1 Tax=Bacillus taeanensis TaxID=273032 RepID=A0A366XQZ7_9BACI|nr:8-amino-7-oxononanoate synthase [Bacillus taeanensis]RBW68317.1 8-amino-7-oxononanoate synthase [Bacillus taeanensis]
MNVDEHLHWEEEIKQELTYLEGISQKRRLVTTKYAERPWLIINGCKMLNLASNNYLGLSGDQRLVYAAAAAAHTYGAGATASRLIVGNHPLYSEVESVLINWKKDESALVVNSGYTANIGVISALMRRDDVVFSDKLNHASIVDGVILSRAKHQRYRHNDLNHLEALLKKASPHKRKLIVTDTVFSMDGDMADLEGLVLLKERYNAILMVDEAHASGIYGESGQGYTHHVKLQDKIDIKMGTFSKALGSFGAYITGEKWLIDYLTNRMRALIYSTALPPAVLGAAKAAVEIVQEDEACRTVLKKNAAYFRKLLTDFGFHICGSQSQIVPVLIGRNEDTIRFAQRLQEEGIAAIPIRPPTVPENEARIRFTVTAEHSKEDLDWAVKTTAHVGKEMGVIA